MLCNFETVLMMQHQPSHGHGVLRSSTSGTSDEHGLRARACAETLASSADSLQSTVSLSTVYSLQSVFLFALSSLKRSRRPSASRRIFATTTAHPTPRTSTPGRSATARRAPCACPMRMPHVHTHAHRPGPSQATAPPSPRHPSPPRS